MSPKWNGVWERLLSVLLTLNIAMMGWLWANVARLADRIDRHADDRAIHQGVSVAEFVGRREFEATRESGRGDSRGLADRVDRIEEKIDRLMIRRISDAQ